jgi:hypothetical protein
MTPANLNQVFIVNNVTMLTGSSFNVTAATANASKFGIWNLDTSAYIATDITAVKRVQFTQSTLGNVISSPIIDTADIVRINYNGFAADTQTNAVVTATGGTPTSSKAIMFRIALRTAPTAYESFANPTNPLLDTTGNAKVFPLVGNFAAGRQIFNIEVPAGLADATAVNNYVRAAILANPTLNAIFATSGTTTLVLTARHLGVEFDLIAQYSDGSGPYIATANIVATRTTPTTNYTQAISAEKSQRARYGNFNRMYFPVAQVDYTQPAYAYDVLEIVYKHAHPASTGIARAAEYNTIKVFFGSSATPLAAAADFVAAFTLGTIGTDKEQVTDLVLQA